MAAAGWGHQYAMGAFLYSYDSKILSVGKYEFKVGKDNKLGEGNFGLVWLGTRSGTQEQVAVKQVLKLDETANFIERENLLKQHKHENIVKLYDHKVEKIDQYDWVFFIMEYCPNGNLNKFITEKEVSMQLGLRFMKDVTCAVEYMHSHDLVHRDIKPENILVRDSKCCVLADFGLSRNFPGSASSPTMTANTGTAAWMAPEVLPKSNDPTAHVHYGRPADIFSLGLVILAIINLQRGQSLEAHTVDGKLLCHWMDKEREVNTLAEADDGNVTRDVKALVLQMIRFKPEERPTIGQVLERIINSLN